MCVHGRAHACACSCVEKIVLVLLPSSPLQIRSLSRAKLYTCTRELGNVSQFSKINIALELRKSLRVVRYTCKYLQNQKIGRVQKIKWKVKISVSLPH